MRRLIVLCAGVAMALSLSSGLAMASPWARDAGQSPAASRAPYCGIRWGSGAKTAGTMVSCPVSAVRAGQHACFDRLVIDLGAGRRPGYRVRYVAKIIQDAAGKVIPVRGSARLRITVLAPAAAAFPVGSRHLVKVTGFRTFRQVVGAGSFEGITSLGLGVRARLPFRVFVLRGTGHGWRLVIDVAHLWLTRVLPSTVQVPGRAVSAAATAGPKLTKRSPNRGAGS